MASLAYNKGIREWLAASFLVDALKVMLLATTTPYTPNQDHDFVDMAGANDPVDAELNVTGYTRGFGGAGRKTLASKTATESDANNRVELDAADPTWTGLGAGETIAFAAIIKEVTNDTLSILYILLDFTDLPTNGSDVTLQFPATGFCHFNT